MAVDLDKINKVDTNITVPSVDDKLMETEKDKWGIILNNAFNILNNNIKIYKEIILELANTQNSLDLSDILLRLKNLEIDRDSIESIVNNNNSEYIDVGLSERRLNLKGTQLEFNNSKIDLQDIAFKSKENTFKEVVDTDKYFTVNKEKVLDTDTLSVSVGNVDKQINLVSKENKVFVNGIEFKVTGGFSFSEVLEITNVKVSSGESMSTNKVNFTNTYKEPPLVIVTIEDIPLAGEFPHDYNIDHRIGEVTTTGFKLAINRNYPINKVYVYVIDRNTVPLIKVVL